MIPEKTSTAELNPEVFANDYVALEQRLAELKVAQQEIELKLACMTNTMNRNALNFRVTQMKEHLERIWSEKKEYPH